MIQGVFSSVCPYSVVRIQSTAILLHKLYNNSNATIITLIYLLELELYFICHLSTIVHLRQYSNKLLEGSRSS